MYSRLTSVDLLSLSGDFLGGSFTPDPAWCLPSVLVADVVTQRHINQTDGPLSHCCSTDVSRDKSLCLTTDWYDRYHLDTPPSRAGGMSGDLSLTSPTASWLESEIVSIMSVRRLKALYIISQTLIAVNLIELNIDGLCLNIKFRLPPPPSTSHVSSELLFQN